MIQPALDFERIAWIEGYECVVGLDEVGRGAWAGPVVAAAVQFPSSVVCHGDAVSDSTAIRLPKFLRDSKKLSASQRLQLNTEIRLLATQVVVGVVDVDTINQIGIGQANFLAMSRALDQLKPAADFVLIDGFSHPELDTKRQKSVIKGDSQVASIAAASIIAKVYRDQLMEGQSAKYQEYNFGKHKGYGTLAHQQAILAHGLSPLHRRNFNLKFLAKVAKVDSLEK